MSIENILSRLNKVKRSGHNQFMACCPAHEDRSPSLSIKDAGDGRILINCLAGCSSIDVLGAIGMDFADVMPAKAVEHKISPQPIKIFATDAIRAIKFESQIVGIAAIELSKGNPLDEADHQRLLLAIERINTVVEASNGY
jgi:hypothetical protein